MSSPIIPVLICFVTYSIGFFLLWQNNANNKSGDTGNPHYFLWITFAGIAIHAALLYRSMRIDGDITVSLGTGVSLAGWISVLIYFLLATQNSVISAGLIVLPIAAVSVLFGQLFPGNAILLSEVPTGVIWHVGIAIPAYGFLCLAFAQACLLILQENRLRHPSDPGILLSLPAMQTMEYYLFLFTLLGFIFMTVNLLTGMISSQLESGHLVQFNHHIVLSLLAWSGFGCLLAGRKIAGWRGETAAKWTISAFTVFFLGYFGTRFVNDIILRN